MIGIVTLENVIERILLTDIHDEKDVETAKTAIRTASVMYRTASQMSANDPVSSKRTTSFPALPTFGGDGEKLKSKQVRDQVDLLIEDI